MNYKNAKTLLSVMPDDQLQALAEAHATAAPDKPATVIALAKLAKKRMH